MGGSMNRGHKLRNTRQGLEPCLFLFRLTGAASQDSGNECPHSPVSLFIRSF